MSLWEEVAWTGGFYGLFAAAIIASYSAQQAWQRWRMRLWRQRAEELCGRLGVSMEQCAYGVCGRPAGCLTLSELRKCVWMLRMAEQGKRWAWRKVKGV